MKTRITFDGLNELCIKIEKLTDLNNHTEAKKIVCSFFGYTDLHTLLCEIEKLHNKAGSLSSELCTVRSKIGELMLEKIKSDYPEIVYMNIKNSF